MKKEEFTRLYEKIKASTDGSELELLGKEPDFEESRPSFIELLEGYSAEGPLVFPYIRGVMESLVLSNQDSSGFYRSLHNALFDSMLSTEREEQCGLLMVLLSKDFPYFTVNVVSMDAEEFKERAEKLKDKITRLFILGARPFSQRTERASAFLDVIESEDERANRSILLAAALDAYEGEDEEEEE